MTDSEKLKIAIDAIQKIQFEVTNKKGGVEKDKCVSVPHIYTVANGALKDLGMPHDSKFEDFRNAKISITVIE